MGHVKDRHVVAICGSAGPHGGFTMRPEIPEDWRRRMFRVPWVPRPVRRRRSNVGWIVSPPRGIQHDPERTREKYLSKRSFQSKARR